MILLVPSESRKNLKYEVNLAASTCSCPFFANHHGTPCKHLLKVWADAGSKTLHPVHAPPPGHDPPPKPTNDLSNFPPEYWTALKKASET